MASSSESHVTMDNWVTRPAQQASALPPLGARFHIEHDGFYGVVIGYYTRLDGKRGVVGQQDGTNIVHVYGEKWLRP